MGAQPNQSLRAIFGPFEYDGASGILRKHGSRVRLQGQPHKILSLLIEKPGQLISREELQRALWPGAVFGDLEQGLNTAVNKLRQTLGDSAESPRYIETAPGLGYLFIAPIYPAAPAAVLEMPVRSENLRTRKSRWAVILLLSATGLAGSWLLATHVASLGKIPRSTRFQVEAPPGFALEGAASRQSFALSPDGSRLVFTAMDQGGAFHAFLRDFSSLEIREIRGSIGAHSVFWPPDGRSVFMSVQGKLRRVSLDDNGPVILCDSPSLMMSGAWLNPEELLLSSYTATFAVSPSGGTPEILKHVYAWPQALPGRRLLYLTRNAETKAHKARLTWLDDPESTKDLVETDSRVIYAPSSIKRGLGYLFFVRAGALLAHEFSLDDARLIGEAISISSSVYSFVPTGAADFSVSNGALAYQNYVARSQLAWVDREGRVLSTAGPADVNVKSARLSPDGRRLAAGIYNLERGVNEIWVFDTATGSGRRLTLDPGLRDAPVWSPDSQALAFLLADGALPRISVRGLGEKDPELSLPPGGFQLPTDWSPDGRFVAFVNTGIPHYANEAQGDVWLLDLQRERRLTPLLDTPFHEANAAFSPNGEWIAFTSNESGSSAVYLQRFETTPSPTVVGERRLVSRDGALAVRWRRDGRELFYLGADGRVHAVPVQLAPVLKLGEPTPLFAIGVEARAAIHSISGFDVSHDGQRFVIPVVSPSKAPSLVVIQNWEAELAATR